MRKGASQNAQANRVHFNSVDNNFYSNRGTGPRQSSRSPRDFDAEERIKLERMETVDSPVSDIVDSPVSENVIVDSTTYSIPCVSYLESDMYSKLVDGVYDPLSEGQDEHPWWDNSDEIELAVATLSQVEFGQDEVGCYTQLWWWGHYAQFDVITISQVPSEFEILMFVIFSWTVP